MAEALMGLLHETAMTSSDPKAKLKSLIEQNKGGELSDFLQSLDVEEKTRHLNTSLNRFGNVTPLRAAIDLRSYASIRALILAGADVTSAGAKALFARNLLLFNDESDSKLAFNLLSSYFGPIEDLPFAVLQPPGTCIAMICRSHYSAQELLPILLLLGLKPISTPTHDDVALLTEICINSEPYSGRVSEKRREILDFVEPYWSTDHHHSLKNQCRIVIRKSLIVPDEEQVRHLGLPSRLAQYLLLKIPT